MFKQLLQYKSLLGEVVRKGAQYCATQLSVTHVFLDVNVSHAFAVELLLHAGDCSVVPGYSVDSCVLQTSLLHHLTANLHNQRNVLQNTRERQIDKINVMPLEARYYLHRLNAKQYSVSFKYIKKD